MMKTSGVEKDHFTNFLGSVPILMISGFFLFYEFLVRYFAGLLCAPVDIGAKEFVCGGDVSSPYLAVLHAVFVLLYLIASLYSVYLLFSRRLQGAWKLAAYLSALSFLMLICSALSVHFYYGSFDI